MDTHDVEGHGKVTYERKDIDPKPIVRFAIALILVAAFVHVLIWGIFRYLGAQRAAADPKLSPLAPTNQIAPEPRLQAMQRQAAEGKELPFDPAEDIPKTSRTRGSPAWR